MNTIPYNFYAQANNLNLPGLSVNFGQGIDLVDTIQLILLFTILTLAPAILILCTCFTRIIVVLSFMRQAIGIQNMPPNQLLIGLALFLSAFVMRETGIDMYQNAISPYVEKKITTPVALQRMEGSIRKFMNKQTRKSDIALFYDITGDRMPDKIDDTPPLFPHPCVYYFRIKGRISNRISSLYTVPCLGYGGGIGINGNGYDDASSGGCFIAVQIIIVCFG